MTLTEFNTLGLTEQQWASVRSVAQSLLLQQALWLSGYFAGFADGGKPALLRSLTVLYGSDTGNSVQSAFELTFRQTRLLA